MAHQVAKRAERDLKSIAYYIATESGSIEIAERQIDAIIERFELLADRPDIGRARDDLGAGSGHDQDDVELEMRRIVAEARSRLGNIRYEPDGGL